MGSLRARLRLIPRALWGVVLVQLLLVILLVSSVGSMLSVGNKEISRAINTQQRVVIDARTGKVLSPLASKEAVNAELVPAYDVAPSEEEDAGKDPEKAPADTPPAPPADTAPDGSTTTSDTAEKETPAPVVSGSSQALDVASAPAVTPVPRQNTSLIPGPAPEVSDITEHGVLPKNRWQRHHPRTHLCTAFRMDGRRPKTRNCHSGDGAWHESTQYAGGPHFATRGRVLSHALW